MAMLILKSKKAKEMPKRIQLILTMLLHVFHVRNYSLLASSNNWGIAVGKVKTNRRKEIC